MPFIAGMLRAAHNKPGAGNLAAAKKRPAIAPTNIGAPPMSGGPPLSVSPALSVTPPLERGSINASIQADTEIKEK